MEPIRKLKAMDIKERIHNLNTRANKLWNNSNDNVVAVCVFVTEDGRFAQTWFANWNLRGVTPEPYDKFISDAPSLEKSLDVLSNYLELQELTALSFYQEGDRIAGETGFGD